MKNMQKILEKVYENEELRKTIVPLFIGTPGLGKTVIIENFAKEKGVALVELITSQMSPFEISGIALPDKDSKKMTYYNFDKLENLKDGDILFFDELLDGVPSVLSACLTILEQRRFISGALLPNIMIVAAANREGMKPMTPQIKERFVWYDVKFDREMWISFMENKYQISKSIGNKLASLIESETFASDNFYTPRSVDKAVNMIILDTPTPYTSKIKIILDELIPNSLEGAIELPNGRVLNPKEMISWLDLIRLKKGIFTEVEEAVIVDDFVLPQHWYVEANNEILVKVLEWGGVEYDDKFKNIPYIFGITTYDNKGHDKTRVLPNLYWKNEITPEQFLEYVYKPFKKEK